MSPLRCFSVYIDCFASAGHCSSSLAAPSTPASETTLLGLPIVRANAATAAAPCKIFFCGYLLFHWELLGVNLASQAL